MTRTLASQAALRRRRRAWRSTKTAATVEAAASTVGAAQARMREGGATDERGVGESVAMSEIIFLFFCFFA